MLGVSIGVLLKEPDTEGAQPLRKVEKLKELIGLNKGTKAVAS